MAPDEQMPGDPYTIARHRLTQRQGQQATGTSRRSVEEDRLKQFLINDGKVLRQVRRYLIIIVALVFF